MFDLFNVFTNKGLVGFTAGSRVLALILYQDTLTNFVYDTDASGNAILSNKGSGEDGLLYTGRGLELGADNDLHVPIPHTLGSDTKQTATLGSGWVDNTGHSYTATTATSALSALTSSTTDNVQIDFTISNYTAGDVDGFDANGTYTIDTTDASLDATGFSGDVLINSVKEITNPDSFLTIVHGDGLLEQIGNSVDGGSSKELALNNSFDINADQWTHIQVSTSIVDGIVEITNTTTNYGQLNQLATTFRKGTYLVTARGKAGSIEIKARLTHDLIVSDLNFSTTSFEEKSMIVVIASGTGSISLPLNSNVQGDNGFIDYVSVKEILPASTHYPFNNQTILEAMPTTKAFTTADLALMEADTTLLARLALGEDNAGGLSLVTADVYGWYPLTENEGAYVVDAIAGYGVDVVVNGTFDTDTDWIKPAGGTIVDGKAVFTAVGSTLSFRQNTLIIGKTYIVIFTIEDYVSGAISLQSAGGVGEDIQRAENGTYSQILENVTNDVFTLKARGETTAKVDNVSAREATAEEITNYVSSIRENVDQNIKDKTTHLELDGAGVPTAVDFTKLNWYGVGYGDTQFNPSLYSEFIIEENVGAIFYSHIYDGVNLTTWTDGVEGTPTAHSPENADYLLGKGVYPKVAIDPYTIYTQGWFKTIDNESQITDYDALQAYNDWNVISAELLVHYTFEKIERIV